MRRATICDIGPMMKCFSQHSLFFTFDVLFININRIESMGELKKWLYFDG